MRILRRPRGRTRRSLAAGVAALALLASVTACGGSDDTDPGAEGTTATSSSSESPSESVTGSADPTTSDSPAADPATGPKLKLGRLTIHAPEGWQQPTGGGLSLGSIGPNYRQDISVYRIPEPHPEQTVDEQADHILDNPKQAWNGVGTPTREPDVTLAGEPAYHLTGHRDRGIVLDEVGLIHEGDAYSVVFSTYPEFVDKKVGGFTWDEVIDSVLASAEWSD